MRKQISIITFTFAMLFAVACENGNDFTLFEDTGDFIADTLGIEDETSKKQISSVYFEEADYDRVFFNSILQLQDMRFKPDRQDRRLGVITSLPQDTATYLVPFPSNHKSSDQYDEATLNHQRRVVRLTMEEIAVLRSSKKATTQPSTQPAAESKQYVLRAEVWLEHRVFPERALTNDQQPTYGEDPEVTEKGEVEIRWVKSKRDKLIESYLLRLIAQRSGLAIAKGQE